MADETSGKGLEAYEARGVAYDAAWVARVEQRARDERTGGIGATELWLRTIAGGGDPFELEGLRQELAALRALGAAFEPSAPRADAQLARDLAYLRDTMGHTPTVAFFLGVNCVTCDVLLSEAGVTSDGVGGLTCNVCGQSAIPGG